MKEKHPSSKKLIDKLNAIDFIEDEDYEDPSEIKLIASLGIDRWDPGAGLHLFSGYCLFSNFYKGAPFKFNGQTYKTAEAAFHAEKALLFGSTEVAQLI